MLLTSCSLFSKSPFETRGLREASLEETQTLIQSLDKRAQEISSFRSLWELSFKRMFSSDRVRQSLVFKRPDKLRAEYFERSTNQLLFIWS